MTDIVERLRAYRMDVDSPDVVYEAADELERLRAQRQAVVDLLVHHAEPGRKRKQLAGNVPVEELYKAMGLL